MDAHRGQPYHRMYRFTCVKHANVQVSYLLELVPRVVKVFAKRQIAGLTPMMHQSDV